jgi:dethiobiotin synthase
MTLVVVGTGTDVGKTVVSALVLARHGRAAPVAYWKPVATGNRDGRDTATVADLAGESASILPESYLFEEPLSPHLAARLAGRRIDPVLLLADFDRHRAAAAALLIETAGGLLVPLAEAADDPAAAGFLQADMLMAMNARAPLSCLVVARSELGTINHTLLTLEALRARRLAIAGIVLDGPPNSENRRAIERFGHAGPLYELSPLVPLDRLTLLAAAERFDPAGRLAAPLATHAASVAGPAGKEQPSSTPPGKGPG